MAELIIVVDATCAPCSALGREIERIPRIRMISMDSAEAATFGATEAAPCLVEVSDSGSHRVRTGWSMRARLARHLGWRRADRWVSLLMAEVQARGARDGASRRTVVLAALLGGLGTAVGAVPAAAATPAQRALSKPELAAAVAGYRTRTAKAATAKSGYLVGSGATRAHALVLDGGDVLMVPLEDPTLSFVVKTVGTSLVYEGLDGKVLARLTASSASGTKRVIATAGPAIAATGPATPLSPARFTKCFVDCLGGEVDFGCIWDCATGDMVGCAVCSGYAGVVCALRCRKYW